MKSILFFLVFHLFAAQANAAKILFIGDSHSVATVGPFGIRMNQLLRSLPNAEVEFHARCGSVMSWWYSGKSTTCGYFDQGAKGKAKGAMIAPTPKIIPILERTPFDLIIVELGANYRFAENPPELAKQEIQKFISDLKGTNCIWIGPPTRRAQMEKMPPLVKAIRETVESACSFIDSTTLTTYPLRGGDGVHFSFPEGIPIAHAWADSVFSTIKTHYEKK